MVEWIRCLAIALAPEACTGLVLKAIPVNSAVNRNLVVWLRESKVARSDASHFSPLCISQKWDKGAVLTVSTLRPSMSSESENGHWRRVWGTLTGELLS